MKFYHHHIGDYAQKTQGLSILEHGVYRLLLDFYYSTEAPISNERRYRIVGARTDDEKAAVDLVLSDYFQLSGDDWIQKTCEETITRQHQKAELASKNGGSPCAEGKVRGRPVTTEKQNKSENFSEKSKPKANHKPLTINHLEKGKVFSVKGLEAPPEFDSILIHLEKWRKYRAERKLSPWLASTWKTNFKDFAGRPDALAAAIDFSIAKFYRGIYEPKPASVGRFSPNHDVGGGVEF